ncbi:hypothetical protein [Georgenia alba]|uniref:Uncharacterized protein n=1 Tax=Georgenia alba TaxID=2233858 RepID=A0ABW2Q4T4_9MICO
MPTEIVLLSDIEPTDELLKSAVGSLHPDGTFVSFRGGQIRQLLDRDGRALLSVFPTRPVNEAREATASVATAPASFGLWTDMTIPHGDDGRGREAAEAVAAAVGGAVTDRT